MPNVRHAFVATNPDGPDTSKVRSSNWNAKLQYTNAAGAPSGTDAVIRLTLSANTTYNVATTGSDVTGDGSVGSPWATLQHAMDFMASSLDLAGFTVTVSIGAGTFAGIGIKPTVGGGIIFWKGQAPASTTISNGAGDGTYNLVGESIGFLVLSGTRHNFDQVTLSSTSNGGEIFHAAPGSELFLGDLSGNGHVVITRGSALAASISVIQEGIYSDGTGMTVDISGNCPEFINVQVGRATIQAFNFNLVGTPAYTQFANCGDTGVIAVSVGGTGFNGAATGKRFNVTSNGVIDTGGAGLTFLPGNAAGTTSTGGQYL